MQEFLSRSDHVENLIDRLKRAVIRELKKEYPLVDYFDDCDLAQCMADIYEENRCPFVMIIDEWDCIFREFKEDRKAQEKYLDFLRDLLKDKGYLHLVYMTGILPIKKYGTHSALNMFSEFSMTNPRQLSEFVGFTEVEVDALCSRYHRNLAEVKEWYDGYRFENTPSVYNPKSVIEAVLSGICDTYWNQTETFEALRTYIDLNYDGLRDDVLTLLIHLGYLGYDFSTKCVFIPNNEIREEFIHAVSVSKWGEVTKALKNSVDTLNAIWQNKPFLVEEILG